MFEQSASQIATIGWTFTLLVFLLRDRFACDDVENAQLWMNRRESRPATCCSTNTGDEWKVGEWDLSPRLEAGPI